MKRLIKYAAACLLVASTASCDKVNEILDNFGEGIASDTKVAQLYVVQYGNQSEQPVAFATFSTYGDNNTVEAINLPYGAWVRANGERMNLINDQNSAYNGWNSAYLAADATDVTFLFHQNATLEYTNTLSLSDRPIITVPAVNGPLENGKSYPFTFEGPMGATVNLTLSAADGKAYETQTDLSDLKNLTFSFTSVPAGQYTLTATTMASQPLQKFVGAEEDNMFILCTVNSYDVTVK